MYFATFVQCTEIVWKHFTEPSLTHEQKRDFIFPLSHIDEDLWNTQSGLQYNQLFSISLLEAHLPSLGIKS